MRRLSVWAPAAERVDGWVGDAVRTMHRDRDRAGWWVLDVEGATHGTDYAFSLDGAKPLPDPRSAWQPHGVHGASRVYDHDHFVWHDEGWSGPTEPAVIYELHIGTYSPAGTFAGAIERLDHLVDLGVSHVELLPVATFDGSDGWGYDGVDLFAVHEAYGGPDGCKSFVDACHQRGIGVILDVVYNHLGPSGNHLGRFGPYFTDRYRTPWGDAVNLDGPGSDEVRAFVLDNVESWLRHFHADGLRLDAVHELHDERAIPLIEEIAGRVDELQAALGRPLLLIAESDRNDARLVTHPAAGGAGVAAQWDDDVHHALHALLTGERQGYYRDFGEVSTLAKALTDVFVHDGGYSTFRGRRHGRPVDPALPRRRFVVALQNHDQVGNRAAGDRLGAVLSPRALEVGAALVLLGPFVPMLFMGEEWGASTPWPFFSSFPDPDLAAAVSRGRRDEFAAHGWQASVPDPQDPATFASAKLDWDELSGDTERRLLRWHRRLIAARRDLPQLAARHLRHADVHADDQARTLVVRIGSLRLTVNFGDAAAEVGFDAGIGARPTLLLSNDPTTSHDDDSILLPPLTVALLQI